MKEKAEVTVLIGETSSGFTKFLSENKLRTVEPDLLADYVLEGIRIYEKRDRKSFNNLLIEINEAVGVKDSNTALEVARRFAKVCDTYRNLLKIMTGKENVTEKYGKNVHN